MSTHNIGFYENLTKIIFELSSNKHLISSAGNVKFQNFRMPANCCNLPKIQIKRPSLRVFCQKDAKWNGKQYRP